MKLIMHFILIAISLCLYVHAVPITEQVYFYHYGNGNQTNGTEMKIGEVLPAGVDVKLPWKFFIHGWTTNPQVSPWFHEGTEAYFTKGEYNIVWVDWSKPGNQTYLESVMNAKGAGEYLGKFILHLEGKGVSLDDVHLLGHSLGAHMTGQCGKYVNNVTNGERQLARITGLDPSGPLYEINGRNSIIMNFKLIPTLVVPPKLRLDKTDAHFVDIIHTDSGEYGMAINIGHVDFHPNGGNRFQPGCENTDDENCSHARSTLYFVESINNNNFIGKECENYDEYLKKSCENNTIAYLGEHTNDTLRGIFYLRTNSEQPYAQGLQKNASNSNNFQVNVLTVNYFIMFILFCRTILM